MKKPLCIISISYLILISFPISCFAQQKPEIKIKEGYAGLVGYGSLMSLNSMEQTLGHKYIDSAYRIHLSGFVRAWTSLRPFNEPMTDSKQPKVQGFILQNNDSIPFNGIVQLNIESKKGSSINCILYLISNEDLIKVDKREYGYNKVDVTDRLEEYNITGGQVYVYQQPQDYYDKTSWDLTKFILVKDYIDFILKACDGLGESFRAEFDKSTLQPASEIVPSQKIAWKINK
jgi:hypothetical protein